MVLPKHSGDGHNACEDGQQTKGEAEHELCVVAVAHTVINELSMVVHPLDAPVAPLAVVAPWRLVTITSGAELQVVPVQQVKGPPSHWHKTWV